MRILLATSGSRGDVQPMLALALAFQASAHDVLVAGPPERADWAQRLGCTYTPLGADATARIDSMGAAHTVGAAVAFVRYLGEEIGHQFRHLPDLVAGRDLVIGASLCFGLSSVAEACGVPYRYVLFTPQLLRSSEHPVPVFRRQGMPPWLNRLGWESARRADRFTLTAVVNRYRRRLGLRRVNDWYPLVLGPVAVVASDAAVAGLPGDASQKAVQTGYMHLDQSAPPLPALERFLSAGRRPVYVGFGSMPRPDQARLLPLVRAAGKAAGRRLVVARFWGEGVGTIDDADVFYIRRFPHGHLFPRMAAVVHHGGAGTTATAAASGVPQVVVPHILDQYFWGDRIHRAGLGPLPVWRSRLTAGRLASAIHAAATRRWYREAADAAARRIHRGGGAPRTARAILDSLK